VKELITPKSGSTVSWGVAGPNTMKPGGQFTTAMKVYVPWWRRKTLWTLVGAVALLLILQIDVDTDGSMYGLVIDIFNWLRTQPWLTTAIGGGIGYFVRDRAIQLVSRHELMPGLEKK